MKPYAFLCAALLAACNSGEVFTTTTVEEPYSRIVEYTPAPGQFINDPTFGFNGVDTPEKAVAYAERRLSMGGQPDFNSPTANYGFVSLGGWGGCLVAEFDTPVPATDGYDLWVKGNQGYNSSEPGIVWVAPDEDGDGAPDAWYELKGSEWGNEGYIRNYSVTYTRPSAPGQDVAWSDNRGGSGTIDYLPQYGHTQDSYYPAWIADNTRTFTGSLLPPNGVEGEIENTPSWLLKAFAWGYADNLSEIDGIKQVNRFRIADAVTDEGAPAHLTQIRFIKVQTGVNAKSPLTNNDIGETSTEVCGIGCYRTVMRTE